MGHGIYLCRGGSGGLLGFQGGVEQALVKAGIALAAHLSCVLVPCWHLFLVVMSP